MILAMAVLLFQLPAAAAVTNAPQPPQGQQTSQPRASMSSPVTQTTVFGEVPAVPVTDGSKPILPPVQRLASLTSPSTMPDISPTADAAGFRPPDEPSMTHRRWWIILSATEHSSAAYDAWSTRYALCNGRVEMDPVMKPFANSAAIYGAIQAIPFGLDYVAHRMQHSSGWKRRIWWVPQSAATATFLFSGSFNVAHTN